MTPLVSVVVAARDAEATIVEALDSVLTGASVPVEVIVVDDASVDGTAAVVAEYTADARVRLVFGSGDGPGAARNRGLAEARGEWVTFLDADDVVWPGYLDIVADGLRRDGAEADLFAVRTLREVGGEVVDNHPLRFRFEHGARVVDLDAEPHAIQTSVATAFFRRSVVVEAGVRFDEVARFSEDADFVVSFLLAARPRLGLVPDAAYVYRMQGDTSLSRGAWANPDKYRVPFDRLYSRWLDRPAPPRWLENMALYEASTYFDADRAVFHPAQAVAADVRRGCAERLGMLLARVGPEAVRSYCVTPLGLDRRMALLAHAGVSDGVLSDGVVRYRRRSWDDYRKHTYFFTGPLPAEEFRVDGASVEPADAKVVAHRLFDEVSVRERIVWLPEGEVEASLDGRPVRVAAYAGPPRRLAPSGVGAGAAPMSSSNDATRGAAAAGSAVRGFAARAVRAVRRRLGIAPSPVSEIAAAAPSGGRVWLYLDRSVYAGESAEAMCAHALRGGVGGEHWFVLSPSSPDAPRLAAAGFRLVDPAGPGFVELWARATDLLVSDLSDAAVGAALAAVGLRDDQRLVFLQHGILSKRMWRWLNPRRVDVMLTTTRQEHDWIVADDSSYVLTSHEVQRTGLPRHDALLAARAAVPEAGRDVVLLAPTWDPALRDALESPGGGEVASLVSSSAWGGWVELAASAALADACAGRGWRPVFFLHPGMARAAAALDARGVEWVTGSGLRDVLARAQLVVTDRSSILDEGLAIGVPGAALNRDDPDGFVDYHRALGIPLLVGLDAVAPFIAQGEFPAPTGTRARPGATAAAWRLLHPKVGRVGTVPGKRSSSCPTGLGSSIE